MMLIEESNDQRLFVKVGNENLGAQSIQVEEEKRWARPPAAFFEDFSGKKTDTSKLFEHERLMHGTRLEHFKDAIVYGRDQILTDSGGVFLELYGRNYRQAPMQMAIERVSAEPHREDDIATTLDQASEGYYISGNAMIGAAQLEAPTFLATPDEPLNYGMYLLYCVTGSHIFKRFRREIPQMLAFVDLGWQRAMLVALGVAPDELIPQNPRQAYRAANLFTTRQSYRTLMLSDIDREAFDEFTSSLAPIGGHDRIFVSRSSRSKIVGYRSLLNEDKLCAAFAARGFTIIEPERYDFMTQAQIFSSASVVAGLGGAGMFNVAFCRPKTKVIDIESSMSFVDSHANLFASRGTEYGIMLGKQDETDPTPDHKKWNIDVEKAIRVVDNFL